MDSCWPVRKRRTEGLLGRRDEHEGEADWCVDDLALGHILPLCQQDYLVQRQMIFC